MVSSYPVAQLFDRHVFLNGRPPLSEFVSFVTSQTQGGHALDRRQLAEQWRSANDHTWELERAEAGLADKPAIGKLDPCLSELSERFLASPLYKRVSTLVPSYLGVVELDRLVVFQKHINLEYVNQIKDSLGACPSPERIFQACLPIEPLQPPLQLGQIASDCFAFLSPSSDLRLLGAELFAPGQLSGYSPPGFMSKVIGLVVGFGLNVLNALHVEDRLVLNNGSHRAFALREMGITHAPCLVQLLSRRDELEAVASGDLVARPDLYLSASRPPLLKDYFDPKLRVIVPVQRRTRQVRISFGVEQLDLPAMK
jgi:hypothetical protein